MSLGAASPSTQEAERAFLLIQTLASWKEAKAAVEAAQEEEARIRAVVAELAPDLVVAQ